MLHSNQWILQLRVHATTDGTEHTDTDRWVYLFQWLRSRTVEWPASCKYEQKKHTVHQSDFSLDCVQAQEELSQSHLCMFTGIPTAVALGASQAAMLHGPPKMQWSCVMVCRWSQVFSSHSERELALTLTMLLSLKEMTLHSAISTEPGKRAEHERRLPGWNSEILFMQAITHSSR